MYEYRKKTEKGNVTQFLELDLFGTEMRKIIEMRYVSLSDRNWATL